jgi:hypothetical protein
VVYVLFLVMCVAGIRSWKGVLNRRRTDELAASTPAAVGASL